MRAPSTRYRANGRRQCQLTQFRTSVSCDSTSRPYGRVFGRIIVRGASIMALLRRFAVFAPRNVRVLSTPQPSRDDLDLNFNSPKDAFKSKKTSELVRAYLVYQICSVNWIVENNDMVSVDLRKNLQFWYAGSEIARNDDFSACRRPSSVLGTSFVCNYFQFFRFLRLFLCCTQLNFNGSRPAGSIDCELLGLRLCRD